MQIPVQLILAVMVIVIMFLTMQTLAVFAIQILNAMIIIYARQIVVILRVEYAIVQHLIME